MNVLMKLNEATGCVSYHFNVAPLYTLWLAGLFGGSALCMGDVVFVIDSKLGWDTIRLKLCIV